MNVIVFSKDRAAQLDLFLRTMYANFSDYAKCNVSVLYTYSAPNFRDGYAACRKDHPKIDFIVETDFRKQVCGMASKMREYTIFFVDDIVWQRPFSMEDETFRGFVSRTDACCLSLRLHPGVTYSFPMQKDIPVPSWLFGELKLPYRVWDWRKGVGCWGYPSSLDGHIFDTEDIAPLLCKCSYGNPNQLEYALACTPISKKYMLCYEEARVVNIPANRVQTENKNVCMTDIYNEAWHLNSEYLSGKRIEVPVVSGNACHIPYAYKMVG